jgi:hypothetical protein
MYWLMTQLFSRYDTKKKASCVNDSLCETYVVAISGLPREHYALLQLPSLLKGDVHSVKSGFSQSHFQRQCVDSLVRAVNVFVASKSTTL